MSKVIFVSSQGNRAICSWSHARNGVVLEEGTVHNLVTDAGRTFVATQAYGSSPGANGLNYIALSNDGLTESATSTTLSNEIATSGFSRAQATTINLAGSLASTTTTDTGGTGFNSTNGTSVNVASTNNMVAGSLLLVGPELVLVSAVGSTTALTVARAQYGTTGTAATSGSTVSNVNTTIISKVFTATGSVSCQKAALFSASSGGTMNHPVSMGSRSLLSGDTLTVTFYILIG